MLWNYPPPLPRLPHPGELIFEFLRGSDRAPMSCELRFNGESYGWEVQFFEHGDFLFARGAFITRAAAIAWAKCERHDMLTAPHDSDAR